MSAAPPSRRAIALSFYILLLAAGTGALVWHGYGKWQEEQALRQARQLQAQAARPAAPAPQQAAPQARPSPGEGYRGLPAYFIAGFGAVMALILGVILYLWWSLKDLEGGRRYGEGEEEKPPHNN
ncbi:MAG: hypothetical protein HYZ11_08890 [Candidatus Tectomicrobia bacterium]|uniref:Uncharacterized protein n=1 Tax=Tectimicrobiota bacterium TaxID=2528274 RepID=A0A932MLY8_UNCTE|nr:hypothetical protein [Candidatus Tectomicrobia bacterium]